MVAGIHNPFTCCRYSVQDIPTGRRAEGTMKYQKAATAAFLAALLATGCGVPSNVPRTHGVTGAGESLPLPPQPVASSAAKNAAVAAFWYFMVPSALRPVGMSWTL